MIRLSINGFEAPVQEGKTVLEASREVGVWIPNFAITRRSAHRTPVGYAWWK